MQNLNKLSEDEAQKSFIQRIRKLETFGQSFFSVTVSDCDYGVCLCVHARVCACMVSKCPSLTYREYHSTHLHGVNMHCAHEQICQECTLYSNNKQNIMFEIYSQM